MKARHELTTFWLQISHHTPQPWTMTRTNTLKLTIGLKAEFSLNFFCHSWIWNTYLFYSPLQKCFLSKSPHKLMRTRSCSLLVGKINLHTNVTQCITVTDHFHLIITTKNNEFHAENWSLLSCYFLQIDFKKR